MAVHRPSPLPSRNVAEEHAQSRAPDGAASFEAYLVWSKWGNCAVPPEQICRAAAMPCSRDLK